MEETIIKPETGDLWSYNWGFDTSVYIVVDVNHKLKENNCKIYCLKYNDVTEGITVGNSPYWKKLA